MEVVHLRDLLVWRHENFLDQATLVCDYIDEFIAKKLTCSSSTAKSNRKVGLEVPIVHMVSSKSCIVCGKWSEKGRTDRGGPNLDLRRG